MKILWVKCDFLHPTDKGGQIRTLEMLRRLHLRHEIHFVAYTDLAQSEGPRRSAEYCTRAYPILLKVPPRASLAFAAQAFSNLFSSLPLSLERYVSSEMREQVEQLIRRERFEGVVCDFLSAAPLFPDVEACLLFQHNVETTIWRRHAANARGLLGRWYFGLQAERMFRYERDACQRAGGIVAVSENDSTTMAKLFNIPEPPAVPTGVDIEYFAPPPTPPAQPLRDLVFIGSMDWMPNIDGMRWFVEDVLPRIRARRPNCTLTIAGRKPTSAITELAARDPGILVTGGVPDIRTYVWGAAVSIVPLRIGGGTRLKIYESMAARVPVVSTTIGAEGLEIHPPTDIRIADSAEEFAAQCLDLLEYPQQRLGIAETAWTMVAERFSWESVAQQFEQILARAKGT
jgi:polysaccharide biosynthesis protein PslH